MRKTISMLMSGVLVLALAAPAAAQAEETRSELLGDIGRTIAGIQAELAALDERQASDDWMAFSSRSQGLIEVDLASLDEWAPAVRALRDSPAAEAAAGDTAATRVPKLWAASVLLADAPDRVLEAGGSTVMAWLRDRFGHLQTPARRAELYEAERARLLEELAALRRHQELLLTETRLTETTQAEAARTEMSEVEAFCREITLGETLSAEDGSTTYLGPDIPPIEDLPDWCRDALLVRLTGSDSPVPTPPPGTEVVALEPVHRGEEAVGWAPNPDVRHGRWDGVWEYWGAPGLTLQQVGEYVYGAYQDGDGWVKLAVVDERVLAGRWYEGDHLVSCDEARDGTVHWGSVVMTFDEDFDSYWGDFGTCDSLGTSISGERAR